MSEEQLPIIRSETAAAVPALVPGADGVAPAAHAGQVALRENPFAAGQPLPGARRRPIAKRVGGAVAGAGALAAKFAAQLKALLLLAPKLKLLASMGTALVSVAAYGLFWGWAFGVGFVVLLFIHEMGHVIALRREGVKASAPMFIPFMGAVIAARSLGENALAEARVGLAGPVLGTVGSLASAAIYLATGDELFRTLAYIGFFLNLINLLPVLPLDGGRAMAAMAPWMWWVGFAALIPLAFVLRGPIVFFVLIIGGIEVRRRWRLRKSRSLEQAAYYRVSPRNRMLVGAVYVALVIGLALGMHATYLAATLQGGHASFAQPVR